MAVEQYRQSLILEWAQRRFSPEDTEGDRYLLLGISRVANFPSDHHHSDDYQRNTGF